MATVGADGRYVLVRQIGSGAMGTVHEARDTVLDRPVAVKLIDRRLTADPTFHQRFANEAAILARLDSRSIVSVYDFGTTDDGLFLVTQYLPDGDLGTWLREHGPLDPSRAALVTAEVCDALAQAHRAGIVHRDVKPGNVLLRAVGDSLEGYLADFGIARPHDSELTTTGEVLGTPSYMAPEQHLGEEASPAGDVYAAGCVLWCCLTGHRPYDGTPHQQAMGHLEGPIPRLDPPHPLNGVLARAMAKDPGDRYADAAQMAAALRATLRDENPTDAPTLVGTSRPDRPVPEQAGRPRRTTRRLVVAALIVVLLVALGGAGWAVLHDDDATWRCSDGSTASSRSGCSLPSGAADITDVFPETTGCEQSTTQITARVYALRCDFADDRGYTVTYSAWSSHAAALEHYLSPEAKLGDAGATTWTLDGERAGRQWVGSGDLRKASFLYDDVPYSVSVLGRSQKGLDAGIADLLDGAANPPSAFLPRRLG